MDDEQKRLDMDNQVERLVMPIVLPDDNGIRPAGPQDQCLYCHQKVGKPHEKDCVILERKVKVRYSYEVEIEVPWYWDIDQIEFHRNEGSWCADNSLQELENMTEKDCLCRVFNCEVLEIPESKPYRRNKAGDIVA